MAALTFLRRWVSISLDPDYTILFPYFGIMPDTELPENPTSAAQIYFAAIRSLQRINEKIAVGRGNEYQLGHGIFMSIERPENEELTSALDYCVKVWGVIVTHVEELFFGNAISIGYVLNASDPRSPYSIEEASFAEDIRTILRRPAISLINIYPTLLAAGEPNA